ERLPVVVSDDEAKRPSPRRTKAGGSGGGTSRSDHLVGAEDQRLRKTNTECICCLEIKDQLELRWLLDGKVGRLCSFEYFVDVDRCAAEKIGHVLAIRHQRAVRNFLGDVGHYWQAMFQG